MAKDQFMKEALGYDYNYFGWWWVEDERNEPTLAGCL